MSRMGTKNFRPNAACYSFFFVNTLASISDGSVQDDSKELDDVSARMNEAMALDQSP